MRPHVVDSNVPGRRFEPAALAQLSLAGFEARLDAAERPEIGDYRLVIAELENEIDRYLRESTGRR